MSVSIWKAFEGTRRYSKALKGIWKTDDSARRDDAGDLWIVSNGLDQFRWYQTLIPALYNSNFDSGIRGMDSLTFPDGIQIHLALDTVRRRTTIREIEFT